MVLGLMIKLAKLFNPAKNEVFPAWQGMQYMKNMFEGRVKLLPLNNGRYPKIRWTSVKEVLARRNQAALAPPQIEQAPTI